MKKAFDIFPQGIIVLLKNLAKSVSSLACVSLVKVVSSVPRVCLGMGASSAENVNLV